MCREIDDLILILVGRTNVEEFLKGGDGRMWQQVVIAVATTAVTAIVKEIIEER